MDDTNVERRAVLQASIATALRSLVTRSGGVQAQAPEQEPANLGLVRAFCLSWSTRDLAVITAHLAEDSIYRDGLRGFADASPFSSSLQFWTKTSWSPPVLRVPSAMARKRSPSAVMSRWCRPSEAA
jgi:hypothetical protein